MTTANEAMAHAQAAHDKVESHEDLCAERYAHINTKLDSVNGTVGTILKILGWGGSTLFAILVAALAFFASQAINKGDTEVRDLKQQIQSLQGIKGSPNQTSS